MKGNRPTFKHKTTAQAQTIMYELALLRVNPSSWSVPNPRGGGAEKQKESFVAEAHSDTASGNANKAYNVHKRPGKFPYYQVELCDVTKERKHFDVCCTEGLT